MEAWFQSFYLVATQEMKTMEIHSRTRVSIVLSGGHAENEDHVDYFTYSGSGSDDDLKES